MEVERKLLVPAAPSLEGWTPSPIAQGYLAVTEEVEVRLRRKGGKHLMTVKSSPALARVEEEVELDGDAFGRLWPLTAGRRVVKVRWTARDAGGVLLELDVFEEDLAGLVLLEAEFGSEDEARAWTPPAWAGQDVTGDARYANQTLALSGVPGRDVTRS